MYREPTNRRRIGMSSAMQKGIASAIRAAHTTTGAQSWRVRDVVAGKNEPCASLEMIIDEKIDQGADDKLVMAIAYEFVRQTRAKLMARRAHDVSIARAYELEEQQQGRANVAQVRALVNRCGASLREAWVELVGHRERLDEALVATEAAMLDAEKSTATQSQQRRTSLDRLRQPHGVA